MDLVTLTAQLESTKRETLAYFDLTDGDLDRTSAPGKWSVRYLLHHLSDSETVLYDRICRIISEPRQVLWVYDQDAWSIALDYDHKPLALSKPIYESLRNAIIYYTQRHFEKSRDREFVHSVTGVRTLGDELQKVAAHNEHHLSQIRMA